jgi:hypothetical protein
MEHHATCSLAQSCSPHEPEFVYGIKIKSEVKTGAQNP